MYVDPYDECRVVRQQELKTNVGKVITLKEYRVYPNFLRKYYVIDIDGVEEYVELNIKGRIAELDKIAEAYGMKYIRVSNNNSIDPGLEEFLKMDESVLMEVDVDPSEIS
jgi:hypothetical protein